MGRETEVEPVHSSPQPGENWTRPCGGSGLYFRSVSRNREGVLEGAWQVACGVAYTEDTGIHT